MNDPQKHLEEIEKLRDEIKRISMSSTKKLSLYLPEEYSLEEKLNYLKDKEDLLFNDLNETIAFMNQQIDLAEKLDLIMNILSYKIYEYQHEIREKSESLLPKKDPETSTDVHRNASEGGLSLVELDAEIAGLGYYENEIMKLKKQKLETQADYERVTEILDHNLELTKTGYDDLSIVLEKNQDNFTPLEIAKKAAELEGFKKKIADYNELQTTGWRVITPEIRVSNKLEQVGLKVSRTGLIFTDSGRLITIEDAKQERLLEGFAHSLDELFPRPLNSVSTDSKPPTPPASAKSGISSSTSQMSEEDVNYLKENLGRPLTMALAEIAAVQPRDPIHYLGHWLFKYRYNEELADQQKVEVDALLEERSRIAKEKWHAFLEKEARSVIFDMILHAEEESALNELLRIQREEMEREEEEQADEAGLEEHYESETRDKFDNYDGQGETDNEEGNM